MKRSVLKVLAALLVLVTLLSGCGAWNQFRNMMQLGMPVSFDEMQYVRPDVTVFRQELDSTLALAETETDVDVLMNAVYGLYTLYYDFMTNYSLANIYYCKDVTDIYWDKEYSWCMKKSTQISAGMDQLLYALADCPLRQELETDAFFGAGFFDAYEGDSLWDDTFTDLMEQETVLLDQYYALHAQAQSVDSYSEEYFAGVGYQIEQVFMQLVALRQQIAEHAGYAAYPDFAYEFYFRRDYTPEQAAGYLQQIRQELVPLYQNLDKSVWAPMKESCSEEETLSYVRLCAQTMGGTAQEAFQTMEELGLYDITYSEKKYDASFEVFLVSYYTPYVFMNPQGNGRDKLIFTHEFGHFCNDYAAGGSVVGVDVAEVFSQGLEYLSLCCCENTQALTRMKMADSLSIFVEQAAYASFEQRVYGLNRETLTVEAIRDVYRQVNEEYGLAEKGRDARDYTLIPHIFISPMYVVSYVVSNDAAMQIYQLELAQTGAGRKLWEDSLFTKQMGYMGFIKEAGLKSPFEEGRVAEIRATLEEKLK